MTRLLILFLIIALSATGCGSASNSVDQTASAPYSPNTTTATKTTTTTTSTTTGAAATALIDDQSAVIEQVANLPLLDITSVDSYERFANFAEKINALIEILNGQTNGTFNIPELEVTQETYEKASTFIVEYGPLIENYNDVILAARQVREGNADENEFYKQAAVFGLEIAIICTGVFYQPGFDTIGIIYRASGLSRFVLDCPPCVSFILSTAQATLDSALVQGSSRVVDQLIGGLQSFADDLNPAKLTDKAKDLFNQAFGDE